MGSKRHTQVYRHKLAIDHPHTLERPDDQRIIAVTADDRCKFILGPTYRERHCAQRRMHKSERRLIGPPRTEDARVGKEDCSTCRSGGWLCTTKKKKCNNNH